VVTNVYISKNKGTKRTKGNELLRLEYYRDGPLQSPSNTTDGFLTDPVYPEHMRVLKKYANFWQPIFDKLGRVQTEFNPFSKVERTS
jgi:hypothetical protein